jgi:glycerophosphoryl diester phosphodiesterase
MTPMSGPPLLLGHRGARSSIAVDENTFASFDLALKHGCGGFEFDVRLNGSGRAVVCHDPKVNNLLISHVTGDQLPLLPRLEDVLQRYGNGAFLDIELKVPGLESAVLVALREHPAEKGHVVSSFLPEVILELRTRSATVPLGLICDRERQLARWREMPVEYVIPQYALLSRKLVQELHSADRKVLAWTVNDEKSMLRLAEWKVDGIISDDTELLVRTFQ